MRAHRVDGLEPTMALAQAAQRIVAVRVAELYSFVPTALDQRDAKALHDMRIAAKRLRYVLELVGFCLGGAAEEAAGRARELQTLIGNIHDCDVLLARLERMDAKNAKGIARLTTRFREQREELFARFSALWREIEASGLRDRLVAATNSSPNGVRMGA
jgi:CHAD domain-containing protein